MIIVKVFTLLLYIFYQKVSNRKKEFEVKEGCLPFFVAFIYQQKKKRPYGAAANTNCYMRVLGEDRLIYSTM